MAIGYSMVFPSSFLENLAQFCLVLNIAEIILYELHRLPQGHTAIQMLVAVQANDNHNTYVSSSLSRQYWTSNRCGASNKLASRNG